MSLRNRVVFGVLAVIVVLVASNLVLSATFERHLLARVDDQLAETASRPVLATRAQRAIDGPGTGQPLTDLFIAVADPETGTLRAAGTRLRLLDPPAIDPETIAERATGFGAPIEPFTATSDDGDTRWRLVAFAARPRASQLLVVGRDLADVDTALARGLLIQVVGSAAVVLALTAMAWWVLRLGVRPLVDMADTANRIAAGDLDARVDSANLRTEAGQLGQAFNTMVDELDRSLDERLRSEERVRRFAADASHELRTPLTSIQGYAELWEAGGLRDPDQLEEAMRRLSQEANRMSRLVEDLLLLARLDERRTSSQELVALDQLVADGVADAHAAHPDRLIEMTAAPVTLVGDEHTLRQVIANLLTNACTHTPEDSTVQVTLSAEGDAARLAVSDDGPGLPATIADDLFERFVRADTSRARDETSVGNGLGLSIVRSVAEAHGGRATARTAPGEGFTVVVELPMGIDVATP